VAAAFDEMRFGRENTLDLRKTLPTGFEATRRAETFLRERQMARPGEVLVITGRGNQSLDGFPVVRPAVADALARLRRCGVVESWQEHSPGSFVVTPAPIKALFEAPRRHGDQAAAAVAEDNAFAGLADATRTALRRLAIRSLQELGAPAVEPFLHDEMQRQFSALGSSILPGSNRDARLRAAAEATMDELDGAK
jgi:hypothetical protein